MESMDREPEQRPLSFFEEVMIKDAANDCSGVYAYLFNMRNFRSRHWQMIDEAKKMCRMRCGTFKERAAMEHGYTGLKTVSQDEQKEIDQYNHLVAEINFALDALYAFLLLSDPYHHDRSMAKQIWERVQEKMYLVRVRTAADSLLLFIEKTQEKIRGR